MFFSIDGDILDKALLILVLLAVSYTCKLNENWARYGSYKTLDDIVVERGDKVSG